LAPIDHSSPSGLNCSELLPKLVLLICRHPFERRRILYDPLYRLTTSQTGGTSPSPLENYTYDKTGDRTSAALGGNAATTYTYTAGTHRLQSVGAASRSYDANGNTQTLNGQTLIYDDRNRLASAGTSTYAYNGKGERLRKVVNGAATTFTYNEGGQLLGEYANGTAQEYLYLDGLPVGIAFSGGLFYVEADHLGTPRVVVQPGATTASDTALWKWDFFGNTFGSDSPNIQGFNLRFPGQYFDAETGLNYNYFRDYDPTTGRYVESDPIRLDGGIDTYAYVESGPLSSTDEFGLLRRGDGLTNPQWARLQQAEKRIQDELQKKDGCCIRTKNHFHERLSSVLAAQMIYYRPSLGKVNKLDICGLTYVGGRATTLDALAFQGRCTCLTATLYHELLHAVGLDHDNPNHPENPNDEVNRMTSACAPHLCGAGK